MTASPAVPLAPSAAPSLDWLDHDLRQRLTQAAGITGMDAMEACAQWVREGLERFEAEQAAGRCSLRIGSWTTGPVPLPVQQ